MIDKYLYPFLDKNKNNVSVENITKGYEKREEKEDGFLLSHKNLYVEEKEIIKLCHRDLMQDGKLTKYTRKKIYEYCKKEI
jgi:hypothetical protein